ncbi:hypothetical protein Q3O60_02760 [Alkalimonas collagenimarina]|uniref:Lipoprotein n=1 Tax=Alkalimonas collagenimarina TaxID=400390 RepID=A0ABT9GVN8_9GAMM|nr:hypothetical protein [Alkalimonas collagenimarina]MDP4535106.1 hypothetical protein [Alkalimonas collagenimarina]
MLTVKTSPLALAIALACTLSLTACNDSHTYQDTVADDHDHDHDHGHDDDHDHDHGHGVSSDGRLVITAAHHADDDHDDHSHHHVYIYDLHDNEIIAELESEHEVSQLYTSPGYRFALLNQRSENITQVLDGGLWQEDHGDHMHDYEQAPVMLSYQLEGVAPTHYEAHEGLAALFYDGAADPMMPASISVFSDDDLAHGRISASLTLPINQHGTAEVRGEYLLTTYREEGSATTLPTQVELYHQHGDHYHFEVRFDESCELLHGSYSIEDYTLFGCSDGVLSVEQRGDEFFASKIANPAELAGRIGSFTGHKHHIEVVGYAGQDVWIIDAVHGTMEALDWRGDSEVTRLTAAVDGEGEHYVILDSTGHLHVFEWEVGFAKKDSLHLIEAIDVNNSPRVAVNPHNETIYLTDPVARQLVVVDLHSLTVERIDLDFEPALMTWLGIVEPSDDHHDH